MKTEKEIEAQRRYCAERGHDYAPWDYLPGNACSICARADDERDEDPPEPREPDDGEVSWQEYGRHEAYADGLHESGYGE